VPGGNVVYVITVTTTTTAVNAPITWVAAPITSNTTNTSPANGDAPAPAGLSGPARNLELDLNGCGRSAARTQLARVRVPAGSRIVVRVNRRSVGTLELTGASRRGIPLRVRLGALGRLTVNRPSGRILSVDACD
jgi:hypothetical protein